MSFEVNIDEAVRITVEADNTLKTIKENRYDNFDQYAEVSKITDLEVAKLVIKRLLDERQDLLKAEFLDIAKDVDEAKSKGCDEVELSLYYNGWNEGYNKAIGNISNSLVELEKKYVEQYGCEIVEMYADVVRELKQLLN